MDIINILIYAIPGLAFLVLIHELGHLLIAKWCGIGVEAFSIFFGRAIYSFKAKGIDWRIGWIPFGGYCKMKGQEDFKELKVKGEADEFYQRPPWARLLAVLAGPVFNIILGFILITGITFLDKIIITPNTAIIVNPSGKNLELRNGDIIIEVDGNKTRSWDEVNEYLLSGIHKEKQILKIKRNGKELTIPYIFNKAKRLHHQLGFELPKLLLINKINPTINYGETKDKKKIEVKSPAFNSGMKEGDAIIAINGESVNSAEQLLYLLNKKNTKIQNFTLLELGEKNNYPIIAINDKAIKSYKELSSILTENKSNSYKITWKKGNKKYHKIVNKKKIKLNPIIINKSNPITKKFEQHKIIGVSLKTQFMPYIISKQYLKDYSLSESIPRGIKKAWNLMTLAIVQFKLLTQLSSEMVRENLSGPIGIIKVIGEQGSKGLKQYISMIALLSLFLGVFNLLPIPAVDGGHIVLTLFEMIRRKPLSLKVIQRIQVVGVFIVISIAVLVTINDILKWFTK